MFVLAAVAVISCLYVEEEGIFDCENRRIGSAYKVSSPRELELLQQVNESAENVLVDLLDWQVMILSRPFYLGEIN